MIVDVDNFKYVISCNIANEHLSKVHTAQQYCDFLNNYSYLMYKNKNKLVNYLKKQNIIYLKDKLYRLVNEDVNIEHLLTFSNTELNKMFKKSTYDTSIDETYVYSDKNWSYKDARL